MALNKINTVKNSFAILVVSKKKKKGETLVNNQKKIM